MKINFPAFNQDKSLVYQEIEVQTITGIPELKIIGINGQEAQTIKEKVRTALKSQHFRLKSVRRVVHFSQIDQKNVDLSQFEFQLAAMLLAMLQQIKLPKNLEIFFLGKLSLDGKISPTFSEQDLHILCTKMPNSIFVTSTEFNYPHPNILKITELRDLLDIDFFALKPVQKAILMPINQPRMPDQVYFEDISDFAMVKFCLLAILKQKGSLLLSGSSGTGKSMIFRSLPSLGVDPEAIIELDPTITVKQFKTLINQLEQNSKTQNKIFILNELNDYKNSFIDYLKQFFDKLEANQYRLKYVILGSINPCPCGNYLHPDKLCKCNPFQVKRFQSKIPFPVLDRFDLVLDLNQPALNDDNYPLITSDFAQGLLFQDPIPKLEEKEPFAEFAINTLNVEFNPSKRRIAKIRQLADIISDLKAQNQVSEDTMTEAIYLNSYLLNKNVQT
jgi:magnesium chelatase family protein